MADDTATPTGPRRRWRRRTTRREVLQAGRRRARRRSRTAARRRRRRPPARRSSAHKQLAGTLRIAQWSHFVPAYDEWFDNMYVKRWGEANDTEVLVDHINQADIPARAAAEVAAQSGHDLFWFLAPPAQYEDQVVDHADDRPGGDEEAREDGRRRAEATYNPRTKKYFAFADNYAPDPVNWRTDHWGEVGIRPTTWDNVLRAAPRLRAMGHPIGIGMSNEIDSNMALMALMMCFGVVHPERASSGSTLNRRGRARRSTFARELFRQGMSNEIFAWTAASNNQAMVAGRLSMAMNAISITRTAELTNPDLARQIDARADPGRARTAGSGSST